MSDPKQTRIAVQPARSSRRLAIARRKAACGLGYLMYRDPGPEPHGPSQDLRLLGRAERNTICCSQSPPPDPTTPPAGRAIRVILQQDRDAGGRGAKGHHVAWKSESMNVQKIRREVRQQRVKPFSG